MPDDLVTPCLLVDEAVMSRNIERMRQQADKLGVMLRPHLKTTKSVDIARRVLAEGIGPATVSTLAEAEVFAAAGVRDILYAVGIAPAKLQRVIELRRGGCDLTVILDSPEQAEAVARASRDGGQVIPALIEIDCDGHRGGIGPSDPALAEIGRQLHHDGAELRGVMAHAGESYRAETRDAQAAFSEAERQAVVSAAEVLRQAGLPCPVLSVGSTPTALAARELGGITELRAGVYVFFDLFMTGIGVCEMSDIALSVLTRVIGHQYDRGRIVIDAGWMALSRDRGTANQSVDQGYGVVCDEAGRPFPDLIVIEANQEHGVVGSRSGDGALPDLPIGTRLRILPNHACATAAQHARYEVLASRSGTGRQTWERFAGW
ncbi:DSD1 family PLP-dependent enzyme [Palleronia aestuarii]|uniref:DSD1 family PLP-dependent enzyme n=1 Tax=Palleronia aestuarii TaxID=568105 RepID=UPI002351F443|nr:DSD1 family PLP-dependent enzyme [Palleronia aestuarii]